MIRDTLAAIVLVFILFYAFIGFDIGFRYTETTTGGDYKFYIERLIEEDYNEQ